MAEMMNTLFQGEEGFGAKKVGVSSPTYHRGQIRLDVGRIFANLPTVSGSGPIYNFARAPRSRNFPGRAWARSHPQSPFVDRDLQTGLRCPGSTGGAPLIWGENLGRGAGAGAARQINTRKCRPPPALIPCRRPFPV